VKVEVMWHWQVCPASDDICHLLYEQEVAGKKFGLMINHSQNDQLVVFLDGDFGLLLIDGEIVQNPSQVFQLAGPALDAVRGRDD
jgi:hypothetical protein